MTVAANASTTQNFTLLLIPQTYSISGSISPASSANGTSLALTGAVPVLVQTARGSAANGFSSATVSFAAAATPGDTIVLFARFGGTTVSSVTDNQAGGTNTYTSVLGPTQWGVTPNPTDRYAQVFVAKNIPGGTKLTITVKCPVASTRTIYLAALEYSGVDPVNPINATASAIERSQAMCSGNRQSHHHHRQYKISCHGWDSNDSYISTSNGLLHDQCRGRQNSLTGGSVGLTYRGQYRGYPETGATTTSAQAVADWPFN